MTSKTKSHVTENQSHVTEKSGSNFTGPKKRVKFYGTKKAGHTLRDRNKQGKYYGTENQSHVTENYDIIIYAKKIMTS